MAFSTMDAHDNSTSVSKGCFMYKGKTKRVNEEEFYQTLGDKFTKSRMQKFQQLWENMHTDIEILRSDLNCQIFEDIIGFMKSCHRSDVDSIHDLARPVSEVPTAVLLTGVNTPDHDVMFSNLDSMLKSSVTPLVARLLAQDCHKIGAVTNNLVAQIMNVAPVLDEDEEAESTGGTKSSEDNVKSPIQLKTTTRKRKVYNMTTLGKWYKKHYLTKSQTEVKSPRKKARAAAEKDDTDSKSRNQPLIIVMFEDVENMNPNVFQDFVSLCSTYLSSLPIVLVLGLATSVTAIHQLLPSAISSLLCMEKFQAPPASQYLTQLMDKIIMNPCTPLKLGPKVFHFLLDNFLYHDFSIHNFITGFKYCMVEHFLSNPLSALCCPADEVEDTAIHLSHGQLAEIRKSTSFRSFLESLPEKDQKKCQTEDAFTKQKLAEAIKFLHTSHVVLFPALRFLHSLASELPKLPLGKQFRELYSLCLTEDLCESESFKQAWTYIGLMSLDELNKALSRAVATLPEDGAVDVSLQRFRTDVDQFIYRLNHLDEEEEEQKDADQENGSGEAVRILPQRTKLHELKERLQAISSNRRKSPYERLRQEILDSIHAQLKALIRCPLSLPLHQAIFFSDLSIVKEQLKASPRSSAHKALEQPGAKLKCVCCQCDETSILSTMPDICILYKLHLECGTLVNLYDWLQAFVTVVTSAEQTGKKRQGKGNKLSNELRARFIRAVSELQFLGFIKSTRRKTDHVTRLTW